MSRSARPLTSIQLLRRRRYPVTAAALAGELGASERTVYRDVATLAAQGVPVEGNAALDRPRASGLISGRTRRT